MTAPADGNVFQDFTPAGLDRLAAGGRRWRCAVGEPLLRQSAVSGAMYVIAGGRVRTQRSHPDLSRRSWRPRVRSRVGPLADGVPGSRGCVTPDAPNMGQGAPAIEEGMCFAEDVNATRPHR